MQQALISREMNSFVGDADPTCKVSIAVAKHPPIPTQLLSAGRRQPRSKWRGQSCCAGASAGAVLGQDVKGNCRGPAPRRKEPGLLETTAVDMRTVQIDVWRMSWKELWGSDGPKDTFCDSVIPGCSDSGFLTFLNIKPI